MITVKQELERAEERIELVEYRSAERASEIEEGLESYVTKVRAALYAIQAWLHLYLVWAFMQYSEILRIIVILHVNPVTAKCGQRQVSTKFPNFIFQNCEKQIASCGSTGRELSFEWSHHRIWSLDSKVRVTLQYSIKHSGSERVNCQFFCHTGFKDWSASTTEPADDGTGRILGSKRAS